MQFFFDEFFVWLFCVGNQFSVLEGIMKKLDLFLLHWWKLHCWLWIGQRKCFKWLTMCPKYCFCGYFDEHCSDLINQESMFFSYCSIFWLRHWYLKSTSSQTFSNFNHSWGFAFISVSKFASWNRGQINITLGKKHFLYQKLTTFL